MPPSRKFWDKPYTTRNTTQAHHFYTIMLRNARRALHCGAWI